MPSNSGVEKTFWFYFNRESMRGRKYNGATPVYVWNIWERDLISSQLFILFCIADL